MECSFSLIRKVVLFGKVLFKESLMRKMIRKVMWKEMNYNALEDYVSR